MGGWFDEAQAEAVVEAVGGAMIDNLASKNDLEATEGKLLAVMADMKAEFAEQRSEFKSELAEHHSEFKSEMAAMNARMAEQFRDLYKQLWIMGVGIVAVTVTLIKLI